MKRRKLFIVSVVVAFSLAAFLIREFGLFQPERKPALIASLLRESPDRIELKSPLWDLRVNRPVEWDVQEIANRKKLYRWSGILDVDLEKPGVIVRSGTEEIPAVVGHNELLQTDRGHFLRLPNPNKPAVERIHIMVEAPYTYTLFIPSSTTHLRFSAKKLNEDIDSFPARFFIGKLWSGTIDIDSNDWKSYFLGPVDVAPGTHVLSIQVSGTYSVFQDAYIQNLTFIEPASIEVVLPEDAPPPEIFHRPKQPMQSYLAGAAADVDASEMKWVKSPWNEYDEDPRWVRQVEIQRIVRASLFLPSPSQCRFQVRGEMGSRLGFFPGVMDPSAPDRPVEGILTVYHETGGKREQIWRKQIVGTPLDMAHSFDQYLQPWQVQKPRGQLDQPGWRDGVVIPLPDISEGDHTIVFESMAPEDSNRPSPVFVGEPSILPPRRIEDRGAELSEEEVIDWTSLLKKLIESSEKNNTRPERRIWLSMDWEKRVKLAQSDLSQEILPATREILLNSLNEVIHDPDFYSRDYFKTLELSEAGRRIADSTETSRSPSEIATLNRSVFDTTFREEILPRTHSSPTPRSAPNVILISLDTLRGDSLSCLGYPRGTTPWMRTFFETEGVRFSNAEAPSTWTLPSHTSLFLSQYPDRHGVTRDFHSVPMAAETLAEHLAGHGYETAAFVDRGFLHHHYGLNQGYETYQQKGGGFRQILPSALEFLEKREGTPPLFLFLHTFDIHDPYAPPNPFRERFLLENMVPTTPEFALPHFDVMREANRGNLELTREDIDYARALYDAQILYVDHELSQFFQSIEKKKLLENTLVILISDHGEGFGEHGFWAHGWTLYEEMTHVPMLMRFPDRSFQGTLVEERVNLVDVAPTLMDYLGYAIPENWQGQSLMPVIRDPELKLDRSTYS
ncbi:MAG: sulfatase, partial [Candidatus Omnitrophica bacterium]|nr:sulfatase [Candidatus Omnitrophota bacterium]